MLNFFPTKNLIFFLLILFILFSDKLTLYPKQPIVLRNADSLIGLSNENYSIRNFIGNVIFEQGEVVLRCDTAIQYIDQNRVELMGNVVINRKDVEIRSQKIDYNGNTKTAIAHNYIQIKDSSTFIEAKSGTYNIETNVAHFQKNVKVENDTIIIYSDELIHNTDNDESVATGNVTLFGKKKPSAIVCDSLIHKPELSFLLAYENAAFFYIDSLKRQGDLTFDTLSISASTIFGNQVRGQEFYQFLENVEIIKGSLYSKCQKAEFFASGDSLILSGEPVVWYDSLQLFADTIVAFFPQRNLEKLQLRNNALSISINDTTQLGRIDQISGRDIDILFEQDSIRTIISKFQANSIYFIDGENGEQSGFQRSGADTIYIHFQNNEVENIVWKSNPYIDFYPENIWSNNLNEYYLPRFKIRYDRPTKRVFPTKPK